MPILFFELITLSYSHLKQTFQNVVSGNFTDGQQDFVPSSIKILNIVALQRDTQLICVIKISFMCSTHSEVFVDHKSNLSSSKKSVFHLGLCSSKLTPFLKYELEMNFFKAEQSSHPASQNSWNDVLDLIAMTQEFPPNRQSPLL